MIGICNHSSWVALTRLPDLAIDDLSSKGVLKHNTLIGVFDYDILNHPVVGSHIKANCVLVVVGDAVNDSLIGGIMRSNGDGVLSLTVVVGIKVTQVPPWEQDNFIPGKSEVQGASELVVVVAVVSSGIGFRHQDQSESEDSQHHHISFVDQSFLFCVMREVLTRK